MSIHPGSLGTPCVPGFVAIGNTHAIHGQYGIFVDYRSGHSSPNPAETRNQYLSLQKVNVVACTMDQTMKGQKDILFGFGGRQGIGPNDIICYWVDQVGSGNSRLAGCASHPDSQPACVASALGSPWILAHEIHSEGLGSAAQHPHTCRSRSAPTARRDPIPDVSPRSGQRLQKSPVQDQALNFW